jgi:hypothetical protein
MSPKRYPLMIRSFSEVRAKLSQHMDISSSNDSGYEDVLWNVTLYSVVDVYKSFGETPS